MMSHIYDDRENVNTVDPKELTKMRREHQGTAEFDTDCDVEYERLIAQEIRDRKARGIKVDYTLTIMENLVFRYVFHRIWIFTSFDEKIGCLE